MVQTAKTQENGEDFLRDAIEEVQMKVLEISASIREARTAQDLMRVREVLANSFPERQRVGNQEESDARDDSTRIQDNARQDVMRSIERCRRFFEVQSEIESVFKSEMSVVSGAQDGRKTMIDHDDERERFSSFFEARMRNFRRVFLRDSSDNVWEFLQTRLDPIIDKKIIEAVDLAAPLKEGDGNRNDIRDIMETEDVNKKEMTQDEQKNDVVEDPDSGIGPVAPPLSGEEFARRVQERVNKIRREKGRIEDSEASSQGVTESELRRLEADLAIADESYAKERAFFEKLSLKNEEMEELLREFGSPPNEDATIGKELAEARAHMERAEREYEAVLKECNEKKEIFRAESEAQARRKTYEYIAERKRIFEPRVTSSSTLNELCAVLEEMGEITDEEKKGKSISGERENINRLDQDEEHQNETGSRIAQRIRDVRRFCSMSFQDGLGTNVRYIEKSLSDLNFYGIQDIVPRLMEKDIREEYDREIVQLVQRMRETKSESGIDDASNPASEDDPLAELLESESRAYALSLQEDYHVIQEKLLKLEELRAGYIDSGNDLSIVSIDAVPLEKQLNQIYLSMSIVEAKRDSLFKYVDGADPTVLEKIAPALQKDFIEGSYLEEKRYTEKIKQFENMEDLVHYIQETFKGESMVRGQRSDRYSRDFSGDEVAKLLVTQKNLIDAYLQGKLPEGSLSEHFDFESVARLLPEKMAIREKFREFVGMTLTPQQEETRKADVLNAQSLDDLATVIEEFKFIRGVANNDELSTGRSMADRIRNIIPQLEGNRGESEEEISKLSAFLARITRRHGVRSQFIKLVKKEILERRAKNDLRVAQERVQKEIAMEKAALLDEARKKGLLGRMKAATKGLLSYFAKKGNEVEKPRDGKYADGGGEREAPVRKDEDSVRRPEGDTFSVRVENAKSLEQLISLAFHRSELLRLPEVAADPNAMASRFAEKFFRKHQDDPILGSRNILAREIEIHVSPDGEIEILPKQVDSSAIIKKILMHLSGSQGGSVEISGKKIGELQFVPASRLRILARDRGIATNDDMPVVSVIASLLEKYGGKKI